MKTKLNKGKNFTIVMMGNGPFHSLSSHSFLHVTTPAMAQLCMYHSLLTH